MNQRDRRDFLKAAGTAGAALLLEGAAALARAQDSVKPQTKFRGVNLGGWLVLEKWMAPSLFAGTQAKDEYTLCQALGETGATERLKRHRASWITADDFAWLAGRGINSVRLPVGYWVIEENPPFISGRETLEWAFRTAKAHGLKVLLDLHGVPGSQNGWDHSGREGDLGWHKSPENIAHSLRIVEGLAAFCKKHENLLGIELLNEPRWDVPIATLKSYYQEGYRRVRKHIPPEQGAVVIHDGFRPFEWANFMREPDCRNVILDTHLYQCFSDEDKKRDMQAQIDVAKVERKGRLARMCRQLPCIVGEWSCALPAHSLQGLSGPALDAAMRDYGRGQLASYETTNGWFFWAYRTEGGGGWSFRDCVKRGWLPNKYDL